MDYMELYCKLDPLEPWREILIAQLSDIGFESFEETHDGFKAYIPVSMLDEELLEETCMLPASDKNPIQARELKHIKTINWNEEWERHFEPIQVDDKVYIRAPFHDPKPHIPYEIVIEPKMSFGTGHHETTRLVVQWMLETDMTNASVLDMGCGTGILAILAAKMGASRVVAIDNYMFAYENTLDNLERNGLAGVVARHGDAGILGEEFFDIILANITRNVLLEDMKAYRSVMQPGGLLFVSGFLQVDKQLIVRHASGLGFRFEGEKTIEDWVGLRLRLTH